MKILSLLIIDENLRKTVIAFCVLSCAIVVGIAIAQPDTAMIYAQNATKTLQDQATNIVPNNNTAIAQSNTTKSASLIENITIDHAGGGFTSLQLDSVNKTWITTGTWELVSNPDIANLSNSVVDFNATVISRGTDNSGEHEHKISEFRLLNSSFNSGTNGSEIVFNGTGSVETDVGLYADVPISVRITDESPAIISIDTQTNEIKPQWIPGGGTIGVLIDEKVEDHFGNSPIYGNVKRE
jgi:hypothetical protein